MAAQFIGSTVRLILSDPPGEQVRGIVKEVKAGQALMLKPAIYLESRVWHAELVVTASKILEVDIEPADVTIATAAVKAEQSPVKTEASALPVEPQSQPSPTPAIANDPAIVSLTRAAGKTLKSTPNGQAPDSKISAASSPSPLGTTFDSRLAPPQVRKSVIDRRATPPLKSITVPLNGAVPDPSILSPTPWSNLYQSQCQLDLPTETVPAPPQAVIAKFGPSPAARPVNKVEFGTWRQSDERNVITVANKLALDTKVQQSLQTENTKQSATLTAPFSQPAANSLPSASSTGSQPEPSAQDSSHSTVGVHTARVRGDFLSPKLSDQKSTQTLTQDRRALNGNATQADTHLNVKSLEQPTVGTSSSLLIKKKVKPRAKAIHNGNQNGWATEDATDIQDLDDFDFEKNLSMFDKRRIFDQIKHEDTTADEDRLHTFNRRARPGTAGGKNLHHTENVLASPRQIVVDSSADDEVQPAAMRRGSSSRSLRKNPSKSVLSRQGSAITATEPYVIASGSLTDIKEREPISVVSCFVTPLSPTRGSSSMSRRSSTQQAKPSLKVVGSRWPCPCVSPLQMLEIEQLAISEFGMTEDMLTENAGRCIAETALGRTKDSPDISSKPHQLIIILTGNTKTGARAIAAARHLYNHGVRVGLCLLSSQRGNNILECVRRQTKIYRSHGGSVIDSDKFLKRMRSNMDETPDLIVDAMLGMHLSLEDLGQQEQEAFKGLVEWANQTKSPIISMDIPSGIDASTGQINRILTSITSSSDSTTDIAILADHILSLGAPKIGLLASQWDDLYRDQDIRDFQVADIGIPNAAWKHFGKKGMYGVDFGGGWVKGLDYCDG